MASSPTSLSLRRYDPWLNGLALLVTGATFPLIFMGGLVTTKNAGMSVPDWPNSYGYSMFLFPPSAWVGGIWYEHVHRLAGTFVGLCAVSLMLYAWGPAATPGGKRAWGWATVGLIAATALSIGYVSFRKWTGTYSVEFGKHFQHVIVGCASLAVVGLIGWCCRRPEPRRWVRWLTVWVLLAVVTQGVLGGLRVLAVDVDLAIIHACFAQAFLCLAAGTVVVTSKWWIAGAGSVRLPVTRAGWTITRLAVLCVVLVYGQLVVGALMRHYKAGLAITDVPLAFGKALPPMNSTDLATANWQRATEHQLTPVTLGGMWLHFTHRCGALLVTSSILGLAAAVWRTEVRHQRGMKMLAGTVVALVFTQATLGILTVLWLKPADVASLHVACGALLLMTTFVFACRLARAYAPYYRTAGAAARGFDPVPAGYPAPTYST